MRATLRRNFDTPVRWVNDQAGDTFQNASNSLQSLHKDDIERMVLVTQASHMARSVREFMDAGMKVVQAPMGPPRGQVGSFFASTHLRRH